MTSYKITSSLKSCVPQWSCVLCHRTLVIALNQAEVASLLLIGKSDSESQRLQVRYLLSFLVRQFWQLCVLSGPC